MFLFAFCFGLAAILGSRAGRGLPDENVWHGDSPLELPDGGYILTESDSDHFDIYDVLYYGIGEAIKNADKADVIFLGNSRVLFAFREESVSAFSRGTGIRLFNLCFPAGDGVEMALRTMERNHLSPKIVVVNENYFFENGLSPYGEAAIQGGYWRAWHDMAEDRMSWLFRRSIHRWFPRFGFGGTHPAVPYLACQSVEDGFLQTENFSSGRTPFPVKDTGEESVPSKEELRIALNFKKEMDRKGVSVVLVNIPYDIFSCLESAKQGTQLRGPILSWKDPKPFRRAHALARDLGVPLIAPLVNGLWTLDGSHLNRESAVRFSEAFFHQFGRLPEVKKMTQKEAGPKIP
jgi:hypothetical protein